MEQTFAMQLPLTVKNYIPMSIYRYLNGSVERDASERFDPTRVPAFHPILSVSLSPHRKRRKLGSSPFVLALGKVAEHDRRDPVTQINAAF